MRRDALSNLSNTATRIVAGDDRTTYDRTSIALHWLTAVLVLTQFVLAQIWGFVPRPTKHLLIVAHMSFGILSTAVLLLRILWRLSPRHQTPPASTGWIELAAKAVHDLLYTLLIPVAVLGFVLRWSGNESMSFFGLQINPPFAPFSKTTHHNVGEAHELVGWAIVVLAAFHAAAALFHHFIVHDNVLVRMLPHLKRL